MGKGKGFVNQNRFKSGKLIKQGRKQGSQFPSPQHTTPINRGKAKSSKSPR